MMQSSTQIVGFALKIAALHMTIIINNHALHISGQLAHLLIKLMKLWIISDNNANWLNSKDLTHQMANILQTTFSNILNGNCRSKGSNQ